MRWLAILAPLLLAGLPAAGQTGDADRGRALVHRGSDTVFSCRNCHGLDGRGDPFGTFPRLAGQQAAYLTKQLEDFRAERRPGTQMSGVAPSLSDQDIADVVAHFSTSAAPRFDHAAEPARVARGERLAREGDPGRDIPACASCHGDSFEGDSGDPAFLVPALAGQAPRYLDRMLRWWGSEKRANDPDGAMRSVAAKLSAEDRAAVTAFLGSLPPRGAGPGVLDPLSQR